jgi:hypothetical protein
MEQPEVAFERDALLSGELLNDPDPDKSRRVMKALLGMKKIDMETLK